jgi:ribosomal protein S18 acetylase RimI-like enzyme
MSCKGYKKERSVRLIKISEQEFCSVYSEMEKNFIADERRDFEAAKSILENKEYKIYHTVEEGERVGFVTVWELSGFAFIEHFVTYENHRNKGYGSKVLGCLKEKYGALVLEAEPPIEDIQKRRIAFYERNGFVQNPQKYIQPAYRAGGRGVELVLMSYPEKLGDFENTVQKIYSNVYFGGKK